MSRAKAAPPTPETPIPWIAATANDENDSGWVVRRGSLPTLGYNSEWAEGMLTEEDAKEIASLHEKNRALRSVLSEIVRNRKQDRYTIYRVEFTETTLRAAKEALK